jgi:uncharacterized phage-associated protein
MQSVKEYSSLQVAKLMMQRSRERNMPLNITQTMKLLFIVYGRLLAHHEAKLNEQPAMWPYGPVFPKVREAFTDLMDKGQLEGDQNGLNLDETLSSVINGVLDDFGYYSAKQLVDWSHKPGSPWDWTFQRVGKKWGEIIRDEDIRRFFWYYEPEYSRI